MALDDIMNGIARGMVLGFVTLMAGALATGIAHEPAIAAQADQPPNEVATANNRSATIGLIAGEYASYATWSEPAWCALLDDERPIVRVTASLMLESRFDSGNEMPCGKFEGPEALAALREQALGDGWDDPAALSFIYGVHCTLKRDAHRCDAAAVRQRFAEIDPDNGFAHLLLLGARHAHAKDPVPFSAQEKAQLRRAAQANTYREYAFDDLYDTYRAFVAASADRDPLILSAEAAAMLPTGQAELPDAWRHLASAEIFAVLIARAVPAYGRLYQGCRAAEAGYDAATIAACLAVADLMSESARSYLPQTMGRGLRRALEHPEIVGAEREQRDPLRWQRQVHAIVQTCEMQRGVVPFGSDLPGPMPASHFEQFLADFQAQGERAANLNASMREYERYPEAFALAPARCRDILGLDDAARRELAGQWESALSGSGNTPEQWQKVFRQAAVALDGRGIEG